MFDGRESQNSVFYLARIRLLDFRGLALPSVLEKNNNADKFNKDYHTT